MIVPFKESVLFKVLAQSFLLLLLLLLEKEIQDFEHTPKWNGADAAHERRTFALLIHIQWILIKLIQNWYFKI